jgi:MFS family permease
VTVAPGRDPASVRGGRWQHGLRAFRHRNFRLLWVGQLVSVAGSWMQQVAQGWLVLELTNDPLALGLTAACQFGPVLVFGLFGGLLADALPKRGTLAVTQAAAMVLAVILALLTATGTVQVWHVFVLAALLGVVNALDMPVRQSFTVEIVGRPDVANAVALNSALFNASRIVGPAIAGLLIGAAGLTVCFAVNALSYLAVLLALLAMRPEELAPAARSQLAHSFGEIRTQLGEGLGYVRETPTIRLAITVLAIVAVVGMNMSVVMPLLARDVLRGGAEVYGFLMAASGTGSLLSALGIAFARRPDLRRALIGATTFGLALVGLGLVAILPVSLALMAVLGWSMISLAATTNTLIQLSVPDALRGRVMSVYTTVFAGSTPLGGILAGTLTAGAGVRATLVITGVACFATGVAAWLYGRPLFAARAPTSPEGARS